MPSLNATSSATHPQAAGRMITCIYCRQDAIPATSFAYLSDVKRLLTAVCPHCDRRVTLTAAIVRLGVGG